MAGTLSRWHAACWLSLLVACTAAASSNSSCLFGTLPGTFSVQRPPGHRWQLLSRTCQLSNYVAEYQLSPSSATSSILFLSDSMDMTMLQAFCNYNNGTISQHMKHHTYNFCERDGKSLPFGMTYLPTLTPQGRIELPAHFQQGKTAVLKGYKVKMRHARTNWTRLHDGVEPTLVVMGGGLWDIFRWLLSPNLPENELVVRETKTLPPEMLHWWIECVRAAIRHARSLFPHSHFVWRTYALPAYSASGRTLNVHLGLKSYVVQMRAAGWQAALDEGLEVVDVAALVEEFPTADRYLQDHHHPAPFVSIEVLNIMLNIAARVRGRA